MKKPTAKMATSGKLDWTPEEVRGVLCSPIYAGLGPFPAIVTDSQWVRCAVAAIHADGDGGEQFFVDMLHVLRTAFDSIEPSVEILGAVREEREACAKLAESWHAAEVEGETIVSTGIAEAIRARGGREGTA